LKDEEPSAKIKFRLLNSYVIMALKFGRTGKSVHKYKCLKVTALKNLGYAITRSQRQSILWRREQNKAANEHNVDAEQWKCRKRHIWLESEGN
jgi:hypothetical protein